MKPILQVATATTPEGKEMVLSEHDGDFTISVDRDQLMSSRKHESELELARLGCLRIRERRSPTVLIGGLGMGYTLRQTLDMLGPQATVMVAELLPDVIRWNRDLLGHLAGYPMRDKRCLVKCGDVLDIIQSSDESAFDAILLDVDNGPDALSMSTNHRLYGRQGIRACMRALHNQGCLSIWSATKESGYKRQLQRAGLKVRYFKAAAHKGGKALSRCIWVAARYAKSLPDLPPPRPGRDLPPREFADTEAEARLRPDCALDPRQRS